MVIISYHESADNTYVNTMNNAHERSTRSINEFMLRYVSLTSANSVKDEHIAKDITAYAYSIKLLLSFLFFFFLLSFFYFLRHS